MPLPLMFRKLKPGSPAMLRPTSASRVRLLQAKPPSTVTDAAPFPLSMKTLLLDVGTPALHLLGSLQFPVPPSQMSVCAKVKVGNRDIARKTAARTERHRVSVLILVILGTSLFIMNRVMAASTNCLAGVLRCRNLDE